MSSQAHCWSLLRGTALDINSCSESETARLDNGPSRRREVSVSDRTDLKYTCVSFAARRLGLVDPLTSFEEFPVTRGGLDDRHKPTDQGTDGQLMRRAERGSVLVEAAFVLPVFFLLILGAFDLLWCETAKSSLNYLAQQASVCLGTTGCNVYTYVPADANTVGLNPANVSAPVVVPGFPHSTVTITYKYTPIGPFFPSVTLTSSATSP
jgi:hypothetical protein